MLKFGDKLISNLYFNDKRISRAYMGSKLVYKEKEPIFVDYIEFDGNSYIDSEYCPSSETEVEVTIEPNSEVGICVLGVGTSNNKFSSYLTGYYRFGDTYNSGADISDVQRDYKRQTIYQDKTGVTLNGVHSPYVAEPTAFTAVEHPSYSIYIGSRNDNGNPTTLAKYIGRMYDIYVYENGTLVRHYKPCINPVGVACMYDTFTKKYYYNKGTGKLTAGPHLLDYVKFDGKSWIDTGITELGGTWTVTASGDNSTQLRFLIGNGGQAANYYGALSNGKWGLGTASEEYYFENARTDKVTAEVIFEETQATATVDGVTIVRPGTKAIGNFLLCGYQSSQSNYIFKGDVYHCSYVDTTGKLVLDLYPAIDPSGVVCMFDKVSHTYYYNKGIGEISAGGRFVESIVFDGNSYINTGIVHQTCTIECDIRFEETGTRQLMGFGASTGQYWGKSANQSTFEYMSDTNSLDRTLVTLEYNTDDTTAPTLIVNADGKSIISTGKSITTATYSIGCIAITSVKYWCTCEVWRNTTIINGEVVQDLRPYIDENNIPCFKDIVTNVKFYNKGTGTLSYT